MLFNSDTFLLQFLPAVFIGFLILVQAGLRRFAGAWLTIASLVFYGWWRPENLPILVISILFNYAIGGMLIRRPSLALLILGIAGNVLCLAYYKYTMFALGVANDLFAAGLTVPDIVLPLAISFFTFQQIAYLVDARDGRVREHDFTNYCMFITFFPQLIAGPITHHAEMLPQFGGKDGFRPRWDLVALGCTLFFIGLFKKVVVADPFGALASPIFGTAATDGVQFVEAWAGALAYSLQIYFDFSGYTDMAIGLALLFGISLPPNFNSPYKARNVIDFWARWHMTLTRFLTTYIYNPIAVALTRRRMERRLPLPKKGRMTAGTFVALVAMPTVFTMFVSGVWHGAGWQFLIFGLLHGLYLVVAHGWRLWKVQRGLPLESDNKAFVAGAVLLTFLCVVVALVFFRAPNVATAMEMLRGMAGLNGVTLPPEAAAVPGLSLLAGQFGVAFGSVQPVDAWEVSRIVFFLGVVWALPNSAQWLRSYPTALGLDPKPSWIERLMPSVSWRPSPVFGLVVGAFSVTTLLFVLSDAPTEFLYFQF